MTPAEMLDVLANPGPLTVFVPTKAAFDKLPEGTVEDLLKLENKETLARIIMFHAAPGTYVNGSKILNTIDAANGVVHVVEDVFLPPAEE